MAITRRKTVPDVPIVPVDQALSLILPRDAGEERGLNGAQRLNGLNDLNLRREICPTMTS
jgi:hypothetical protein